MQFLCKMMCMSGVIHSNRSRCFLPPEEDKKFDFFKRMLVVLEMGCFDNESSSVFVTELDANNNLHSFEHNFTGNITDLNISNINFPNTIWVVRPAWEVAAKSLAFLPVIMGGLLSNCVLLNLVWKTKRIQTPTGILISSMAVVDLLTLLLCPWMFLVHQFYQNYVLGAFGCKLEGFLSGAFMLMNVMLLASVSCDRLTAIILPREARLTKKGAFRLAVIAIGVGILFALPLYIYRTYKERQWLNFLETYCTENIKILPLYWHVLLCSLVWFPLVVMTICYTTIFLKLDRYEKESLRRENPIAVNYKMKVARTLFIIVLTFLACRLPFTVLVYWRNYLLKNMKINSITKSFQTLWFISHYLICVNCAINPIIYGLTNDYYRKALISMPYIQWINGRGRGKNAKESGKNLITPAKNSASKTIESDGKRRFLLCLWPFGKKREDLPTMSDSKNVKEDSPKAVCSKITPINEDYI